MRNVFQNIKICGMAAAVPPDIEENIDASLELGERRCKKHIKLTGVERRHISSKNQKMSDLCTFATEKLIERLGWNKGDIKVLVLITQHPDFVIPSTSYYIQMKLGLSTDCTVFDVNLGCSAYNSGIQIVGSILQQYPLGSKGICMQGDMGYKSVGEGFEADVLADTILFGSAGSAVALEKTNENDTTPLPLLVGSDGSRYDAILRRFNYAMQMNGMAVYNFSTNDVVDSIKHFMKDNGITDNMIDYYVFHQAQQLILDDIACSLGIPENKELRSLKDFGNTSGASIPLSICANREAFCGKSEIRIFSCGFGVGLAWSMSYATISTENILDVILCGEGM